MVKMTRTAVFLKCLDPNLTYQNLPFLFRKIQLNL